VGSKSNGRAEMGSIYTRLTERLRTSSRSSDGTIAQLRRDLTRSYVSIRDYIACSAAEKSDDVTKQWH